MRYLKKYNFKNYKWLLVLTLIGVAIFSVMIVGSAQESLQSRQLLGFVIGFVAMFIVSLIDYKWIIKLQWLIYSGAIVILLWAHFFGVTNNGAQRWINLYIIEFQPSELVKIMLILFFAKFFMDNQDRINNWKIIATAVGLFAIPALLILAQPDLSTTLSITAVFIILIFMSGLPYKTIGMILLIAIPTIAALLFYVTLPNQILLRDYQQTRVLAWLQPEDYVDDAAYQQINSKIAIGSGQLDGKGLNNNTTTSLKNGNFIVEPQTDFIFAIIGEELGFKGAIAIIIALFLIIMQCIMIGVRTQIFAGKLICYGVASQIAIQSFINMGVATALLPNTGIPLPFVSYGLSSLVSMLISIGIVLNIGLQQKKYQ